MSVEEQNYQLEVLEYAIHQSIDRLLPSSSEDALSMILYQSNEVVWRVATEIYTNSGHQVDFVFIRGLLDSRIEPLRNHIAEQARIRAEQERIRKEEEQQKLQEFREEYPNSEIDSYKEFDIFMRIKNIIIEVLEEDEASITLDYILLDFNWNYFSGISGSSNQDYNLDLCEFVMAMEEEFDIEIPDEEAESFLRCSISWLTNFIVQKIN